MISLTRNGMTQPPARQAPEARGPALPSAEPPQVDRAQRAVQAAADHPLSRPQKTALVLFARTAFHHLAARTGEDDFETFRKDEAIKACGRRISEARNSHFSALKSHFLNLAGEAGRAFDSAMREATNDQRIALNKLAEECAARGLDLKYPAAIAWNQFKLPLDKCSAKQLWCLVFTIRNRKKALATPDVERPTSKGRTYVLEAGGPDAKRKYKKPVLPSDPMPIADEDLPF